MKSQRPAQARRNAPGPRPRRPGDAEPATAETTSGLDWAGFMTASIYLIAVFVYRALVPAHEGDSMTMVLLTMALDATCLGGLVAMRLKLARERTLPAGENALFWAGLLAGLGLFVIRFSGEGGWWTGHIVFSLD